MEEAAISIESNPVDRHGKEYDVTERMEESPAVAPDDEVAKEDELWAHQVEGPYRISTVVDRWYSSVDQPGGPVSVVTLVVAERDLGRLVQCQWRLDRRQTLARVVSEMD